MDDNNKAVFIKLNDFLFNIPSNFLTRIAILIVIRLTAIKPSIRNITLFHIVRNKARSSIDL
nr:hypothetical protein MACL_00002282 [Theileria orientalis]